MSKFGDTELAIQLLEDGESDLAKIMLKSNMQKIMNTGAISAAKIASHLDIEFGHTVLVTYENNPSRVTISRPNDLILKAKERLDNGR